MLPMWIAVCSTRLGVTGYGSTPVRRPCPGGSSLPRHLTELRDRGPLTVGLTHDFLPSMHHSPGLSGAWIQWCRREHRSAELLRPGSDHDVHQRLEARPRPRRRGRDTAGQSDQSDHAAGRRERHRQCADRQPRHPAQGLAGAAVPGPGPDSRPAFSPRFLSPR
jgi:hypothetical protein